MEYDGYLAANPAGNPPLFPVEVLLYIFLNSINFKKSN
jgi:hypothetical protein